jgi:hypothetical protein
MIYGPKPDGTYVVEFKMADGEALAISVPASETRVLKYFRSGCPAGCSCRTFRIRACTHKRANFPPGTLVVALR